MNGDNKNAIFRVESTAITLSFCLGDIALIKKVFYFLIKFDETLQVYVYLCADFKYAIIFVI